MPAQGHRDHGDTLAPRNVRFARHLGTGVESVLLGSLAGLVRGVASIHGHALQDPVVVLLGGALRIGVVRCDGGVACGGEVGERLFVVGGHGRLAPGFLLTEHRLTSVPLPSSVAVTFFENH